MVALESRNEKQLTAQKAYHEAKFADGVKTL
jgi:hypothetical protein